uniref:C2H2-type domain-containing protein n=1 Tax=Davidia involucrata TaxID=16924 RepID=A0A5B6ZLL1_DAVIN
MSGEAIQSESAAQILVENYKAEGLCFVQVRRPSLEEDFEIVCTLCGFDCDSDEELRSHFTRGIIHEVSLEVAEKTLLKSNPWPFDDGYIFFHGEGEGKINESPPAESHIGIGYKNLRRVGYGEIAVRKADHKISKIWCEFLGNNNFPCDLDPCDFAIVTFRYRPTPAQACKVSCMACDRFIYEGKDASTLLNTRTRELACTGTHDNGAFHFFHTRCIVLWLLICDYHGERACCPDCCGIGELSAEGEGGEKSVRDKVTQYHEYLFGVRGSSGAWFFDPEVRENPTIGLTFSLRYDHHRYDESPTQQKVVRKKSITFYRAEEN